MSNTVVHFNAEGNRHGANAAVADDTPLQEKIIAALRNIYDPELPVNIYDLGLVYEIEVRGRQVDVVMTLTSPNCPVAGSMPGPCPLETRNELPMLPRATPRSHAP